MHFKALKDTSQHMVKDKMQVHGGRRLSVVQEEMHVWKHQCLNIMTDAFACYSPCQCVGLCNTAPVAQPAMVQNQQAACLPSVAAQSTHHLPQLHRCRLCKAAVPRGPHVPAHYTGQRGTARHQDCHLMERRSHKWWWEMSIWGMKYQSRQLVDVFTTY